MKKKQAKFIKPAKSFATATKPAPKTRKPSYDDEDIDEFYEKREKILLGDSSDNAESEQDEEVLALDDESSEGEERDDHDMREVLAMVPALRKHLKKPNVEELGADVEDTWGSNKKAYYDDDAEEDSDAIGEEVEEIKAVRKKALGDMDESDFVDSFGSLKDGKAVTPSGAAAEDLEQLEDDFDVSKEKQESLKALPKKELQAHLASESPELKPLLSELSQKVLEIKAHIVPLLENLKSADSLATDGALSILDLKNQLYINYLMNLVFYMYLKADGRRIKDHPVIKKLVELRLYLEKLRPIELKLKHQIQRLVNSGESSEAVHQPRPDQFVIEAPAYERDAHADVYKPPRIASVHYDDEPGVAKKKRDSDRLRVSASTARMLKDAMADFDEAPEELHDAGNVLVDKNNDDEEWKNRLRTEEELMTRLPMTKKDKKLAAKKSKFANELLDLEDFGDVSFMKELASASKEDRKSSKRQREPELEESAEEDEEEHELYLQAENAAKERKIKSNKLELVEYADEEEADGKRAVGYKIMKNKGLQPTRSKEQRNPRVKNRKKYERSLIKLKSIKTGMKQGQTNYGGEDTGIKKNFARSVKFQ